MSDTSDSSYDYTTSYEVTSTMPTYDTTSYTPDPSAYVPADVVETGSYSYDSTDWSEVADVSGGYNDLYYAQTDVANSYYEQATAAWLDGDVVGAYELNQQYLEASAGADVAWDASSSVWSDMAETTTVTSYDSTGYYDTTGYDATWSAAADTSWSAAADTSWSAAADTSWSAAADTSWSAASTDTSWSAASTDTSWSASADTSSEY